MADKTSEAKPEAKVADRWWVETAPKNRPKPPPVAGPAGTSFFTVAHDFEQDRARERLTDNNLKLLQQANPPEAGWGYVQLAETTYPTRELDRIKQLINLPPYARGAIMDSGRTVRVLVTGTPIGERILELALGEAPSFDCWVDGEWVREELFDDVNAAVKAFRRFIVQYLSPEGIAHGRAIAAQA
ncbi:MAG TPA: hypothetical protein VL403_16150 [Candidatus Kryptonia bacterium]|nr:hypothetical protein [Candidatus Kryptonia bacterium]